MSKFFLQTPRILYKKEIRKNKTNETNNTTNTTTNKTTATNTTTSYFTTATTTTKTSTAVSTLLLKTKKTKNTFKKQKRNFFCTGHVFTCACLPVRPTIRLFMARVSALGRSPHLPSVPQI